MNWIRISGPKWTFVIIEKDGVVVDSPPISKWAIGKPLEMVLVWWAKKGADKITKL
jgi:hypothetical protein